jgi:hypothetical protein
VRADVNRDPACVRRHSDGEMNATSICRRAEPRAWNETAAWLRCNHGQRDRIRLRKPILNASPAVSTSDYRFDKRFRSSITSTEWRDVSTLV